MVLMPPVSSAASSSCYRTLIVCSWKDDAMVMGSLRQETEVVVVGGGPGGYVAAIRAADLGQEVMLVDERDRLGGVCLLEGCIPSKSLIHAVELVRGARAASRLGLHFAPPRIDLAGLRAWTSSVVDGLAQGVANLVRRRGIEVVQGRARFDSDHSLALEGGSVAGVDFRHAIIATGSRPRELPRDLAGDVGSWTSREATELPSVPERLLVLGGGYIGLELGLVYAGLGSAVTLVELNPHLLAGADADLVAVVSKAAEGRLDQVFRQARLQHLDRRGNAVVATLDVAGERSQLEVDQVLVCVGRQPNSESLHLANAGLEVNKAGFIVTDDLCRTSVPHIFAIGDVTPGPMLAHKASREAKVAAEVLSGQPAAFDNLAVPAVVYTEPEMAWTGLTEDEARRRELPVKVGKFPLTALGRARTLDRAEGVVKVLSRPDDGLVLGVGMVGPQVSELIGEATLALEMGATLEDLMVTIHPHPTLSESLVEAAEVAAGAAIHLLPRHPAPAVER
jgi:dihydrolipoamide dehydrogenase